MSLEDRCTAEIRVGGDLVRCSRQLDHDLPHQSAVVIVWPREEWQPKSANADSATGDEASASGGADV